MDRGGNLSCPQSSLFWQLEGGDSLVLGTFRNNLVVGSVLQLL